MAIKFVRNAPPARLKAATKGSRGFKAPVTIAFAAGAMGILALSITQVGRISPKRGDVQGIVQQLRKGNPAGSTALPAGVQPTRGTKMWGKKTASR